MKDDLKIFLANTQLWKGLPPEEIDAIANISIPQSYGKDEVIFWEGELSKGFFMVISGQVKVFKLSAEGKEQILNFFGVGEHFAEVPAFDGKCFPASAAAVVSTELLVIPRTAFLQLLHSQPTLAINILAIFARHLRRATRLIADLSLKEVPGRLAAYLLELSDRNGNSETVTLEITKAQLAALLGTIPETLSRSFAKLDREGLITNNGSSIKLLNREGLLRRAGKLD